MSKIELRWAFTKSVLANATAVIGPVLQYRNMPQWPEWKPVPTVVVPMKDEDDAR